MSRCENMDPERLKVLNRLAAYAVVLECNDALPPIPICEMFNRGQKRLHPRVFEKLASHLVFELDYKYTEVATVLGVDHSGVKRACGRYYKLDQQEPKTPDPTPEQIEQAKAELRG